MTQSHGTRDVHDPAPGQHPAAPETHPHPGPREYVKVAIILAVITALEVGLYYIDLAPNLLIVLLLAFSALKFALVVLYFMHLKFDSPVLKRLFVTGLVLAGTVYLIVFIVTLANRKSGAVLGG